MINISGDEIQNINLVILVTLLIARLKLIGNSNIFTVSIVNIFGTFLHELMHFIVGFILFAKPVSFSIFPKKSGDGYTLGSVEFMNLTWWNSLPVAMAPLLLLGVAYEFHYYFYEAMDSVYSLKNQMIYILVMAVIIDNSIPSSVDFRVGFGSLVVPFLIGIVILIGIYSIGNILVFLK